MAEHPNFRLADREAALAAFRAWLSSLSDAYLPECSHLVLLAPADPPKESD